MPAKTEFWGIHLWIAPEANGFSATTKPSQDADWLAAGHVSELVIDPQVTERVVRAAAPGKVRRLDVVETARETNVRVTLEQTNRWLYESIFGADTLAAGTDVQFNPEEGGTLRGWVKLAAYDQDDTLALTVDLWCRIKAAGPMTIGTGNSITCELELQTLYSSLNTGQIEDLE